VSTQRSTIKARAKSDGLRLLKAITAPEHTAKKGR
jgi:hypothetical protein